VEQERKKEQNINIKEAFVPGGKKPSLIWVKAPQEKGKKESQQQLIRKEEPCGEPGLEGVALGVFGVVGGGWLGGVWGFFLGCGVGGVGVGDFCGGVLVGSQKKDLLGTRHSVLLVGTRFLVPAKFHWAHPSYETLASQATGAPKSSSLHNRGEKRKHRARPRGRRTLSGSRPRCVRLPSREGGGR